MTTLDSRRTILIGAAVGLAAVLLIGNFVAHDLWAFAFAAAMMAALWLLGWQRGWATPIDLGFIGMVGLAAFGAIASVGRPTVTLAALLMLAATVCALAAWDVMHFDLRLRTFAPKTPTTHSLLDPRHLWRVAVAAGVGLTMGAFAILLRTQLSFTWVALVLLLALLLFALSLRELRADA